MLCIYEEVTTIFDTYCFRDYETIMQIVPILYLSEAELVLVVAVRYSSFSARRVCDYCSLTDYVSFRHFSSSFHPTASVCSDDCRSAATNGLYALHCLR